jgi:hypothetical protein
LPGLDDDIRTTVPLKQSPAGRDELDDRAPGAHEGWAMAKRQRLAKSDTPDTPADEQAEQSSYLTMSTALAQIGTSVTRVADAVAALLATPEPAAGEGDNPDDEQADRDNLAIVVTNARTASDALATVAELARAARAGLDGEVLIEGRCLSDRELKAILARVIARQLLDMEGWNVGNRNEDRDNRCAAVRGVGPGRKPARIA